MREGIPVVARGAGTGLAGGCIPLKGGIVLSTARMNRIISIVYRNMIAVVEPGVVNLDLTAEVAPRGFQYVPDPSSEKASTIGGNVATNAGGPHTLAYGVTTNHVLGLEVVTPQGEVVTCWRRRHRRSRLRPPRRDSRVRGDPGNRHQDHRPARAFERIG